MTNQPDLDGPHKLVELINAQTSDVWPLALGLLYVGFVILAQLFKNDSGYWARIAISIVMLSGVISLVAGYLVKGALIYQVKSMLVGNSWEMGSAPLLSVVQAFSPLIGAILLVILVFASHDARAAVIGVWGK